MSSDMVKDSGPASAMTVSPGQSYIDPCGLSSHEESKIDNESVRFGWCIYNFLLHVFLERLLSVFSVLHSETLLV